ncbi:hypothetical protein B0H12DRAFT_1146390 [Mycena haematopus]|nr:hypothetical protein B0H12DRAFT_1146390 [Mycena haematopus]
MSSAHYIKRRCQCRLALFLTAPTQGRVHRAQRYMCILSNWHYLMHYLQGLNCILRYNSSSKCVLRVRPRILLTQFTSLELIYFVAC